MKVLIKNGDVVSGAGVVHADVLAEDGLVTRVEAGVAADGAEVLDASGCLVFPGFIDTHTHFDLDTGAMRTADNFETGTRAAVAGGTTTVLDFATQNKGETLAQALENWHGLAQNCSCDYGFHMAVTDWNPSVRAELAEMTAAGVTSYKLYMAYDALRVTDAQAYEVLLAAADEGAVVGMHCENGDLVNELVKKELAAGRTGPSAHPASRPPAVEAEAVNRFLTIARLAGCPVNIVHTSSKAALDTALLARLRGQAVYIETCPQYLLLDDSNYEKPGFEGAKYVMSPPLRQAEDIAALWGAVSLGEVDTVGTDHCSFNFHGQKDAGRDDFSKIPNGAPGVQLRPQLMYTYGVAAGRITNWDLCRMLCENPAKLFGLYPQKGVIRPGSDADLVVWDPAWEGAVTAQTQLSACDYTPFEGFPVKGRARDVLLRGRRVAGGGEVAEEGQGRYVARGRSGAFL